MIFSLLTPSRGRPARFRAMLDSVLATAARKDLVRIELLVDPDDAALPAYEVHAREHPCVHLQVAPQRMTVAAAFQYLADRARGDILMMGSDDILFRTPGWDHQVRAALGREPGGIALVYPSDGHGNGTKSGSGEIKGNHWFVSRRWIEAVGCFCPTAFEHFCCDTVPERIAAQAGCFIHLPEVLVEHVHFKYGQAVKDETYAYTRQLDAAGLSMSKRDEAKMAAMAPWIAERANAVRAARERAL